MNQPPNRPAGKVLALSVLLGAIVLSSPSTFAAMVAGRVIAAHGEAAATRANLDIPLSLDAAVEIGDLLKTGANGYIQVLFSDEALLALKPRSVFQVIDYTHAPGEAARDNVVMRLVSGGFRTITGVVGKLNQKAYEVRTADAVFGLRGTTYQLVTCQSDCLGDDGAPVSNGTYGAVIDGRIAVTNDTGEYLFQPDQFFVVRGRDMAPETLAAPPGFLYEKIGRGKSPVPGAAVVAAPVKATTATAATLPPNQDVAITAPTGLPLRIGGAVVSENTATTYSSDYVGIDITLPITEAELSEAQKQNGDGTIFWTSGMFDGYAVGFIAGPPASAIPGSGSASFLPIGGPMATGVTGAINVNFASRAVSLNNLGLTQDGFTFSGLNGSGTYDAAGWVQGGQFTSGACSGRCTTLSTTASDWGGALMGKGATHFGLGYALSTNLGTVSGVHGFRR